MVCLVCQTIQLKYPTFASSLYQQHCKFIIVARAHTDWDVCTRMHWHTHTHSCTHTKYLQWCRCQQHACVWCINIRLSRSARCFNVSEYYQISKLLIKVMVRMSWEVWSMLSHEVKVQIHTCVYTQLYQCRLTIPVFLLSHLIPHRPAHFQGLSFAPCNLIVSLVLFS